MNLKLNRKFSAKDCIVGELSINGTFECFTLEDIERPLKIAGVTAIPRGFYEVVITFSERFKKPMPLLQSVPNYSGVRIHSGNSAADTEGCILVGTARQDDKILNSRAAFDALFQKLEAAAAIEKIIMEVTGEVPITA